MRFRLIALFALSASLGACNVAMSDKPLFGETLRSPTLILEDGIWTLDKPDCTADLAKPRKDWPPCVDWVIVGSNKALLGSDSKPGDGPEDILIVDGKPPLLQAKVTTSGSPPAWGYLVFHPGALRRQAGSRRWKYGRWLAAPRNREVRQVPKIHPYPGLAKSAARLRSTPCARRRARSAPRTPKP